MEADRQDPETAPGRPLWARLEAVLLVVDEPATPEVLAVAVEASTEAVTATLHDLRRSWAERGGGVSLREIARGWRFYTAEGYDEWVERYLAEGPAARLSTAALEVLAIVAYRQPVSRAQLAAVRGVSSDTSLRTLVSRGMVAEVAAHPATGAALFGTTERFLEHLGLPTLGHLPSLALLLPDLDALADA